MRLLRVGERGAETPAVRGPEGRLLDVRAHVRDYDRDFFAGGGLDFLRGLLDERGADLPVVPDGVRIGAPVARPGTIACIGLNYVDHAAESKAEVPEEPTVFFKATNTVVGPYDDVLIPVGSRKTDWEIELAVVIGATCRYLPDRDAARAAIAGYTLSNDVSERDFQLRRGGQWVKGKSCETFNPLGPELVTADEVPDPQSIFLRLSVNGEEMQACSTREMVFDVYEIVRYLSQFMVLEPGDVINTGTPSGVGMGRRIFLKDGDVISMEAEGLGNQEHTCHQATA